MGVCWNTPGDLITAGLDHTIRLWSLETQTNKQTIVSFMMKPFYSQRFRGNNLERNIDIWYIAIEVVRFQFGLVRFSLEPSWDPNALKFSCWWKHQYLCNRTLPTQIFDAITGATKHLWTKILLAIWVISDQIEKKLAMTNRGVP